MFSRANISLIALVIWFCLIFDIGNGLKCRMENDIKTQEEFEETVKNCLNADSTESNNNSNRRKQHNNNNSKPWGNRGNNDQRHYNSNNSNNRGSYNNDDEGQQEDDRKDGNNRRGNNSGGKKKQPGRFNNKDSNERDYDYDNDRWYDQDNNRRQPGRGNGDSHSYGSHRREQNDDNRYNNDPFNRHFNTSRIGTTSIGSPLENIDACVIHCIFRQMKMVSDESYLNRNTVLNVLTRRIKDQELKKFILESVNECFENLDPDDEEMCDYSKSFAMCLEEKGKSNCDDWDLSAKFDRNNRSRNNSNNNNSNNNNHNNNNNGFSHQNSQSRG